MPTPTVDPLALHVHHVVILQEAFSDAEVILLYFSLGAFYRFRYPGVLDYIALFVAEPIHHFGQPVRPEEP